MPAADPKSANRSPGSDPGRDPGRSPGRGVGHGVGRGTFADGVGWQVALALCVVAYGFYVTGFNVSRRDLSLDGDLLYLARIVQLASFFVAAFLFRDHIPDIRRLMGVGTAILAAHLLLSVATAAWGFAQTGGAGVAGAQVAWAAVCSHVLSGVANAIFVLLLAHFFSTYGPAASSVGIASAFLLKELLFAWTSVWPQEWIAAGQIWMRVLAVAALLAAARFKDISLRQDGHTAGPAASGSQHPLQYGVPVVADNDRRPFAYLLNGADWAFQLIVAAVTPFVFGFMSQLVSTGGLSDGLHDSTSEIAGIAALVVVLAVCVRAGSSLGFLGMFCPVMLLYTAGLLLFPVLWETGSPVPTMLLKSAEVVNESLLWVLLARKAFQDPRHTYLYFGTFFGVWNVTYGRFLEPIVLGGMQVDATLLAYVSNAFLTAFVCICLLLFVLQRMNLSSPAIPGAPVEGPEADPAASRTTARTRRSSWRCAGSRTRQGSPRASRRCSWRRSTATRCRASPSVWASRRER